MDQWRIHDEESQPRSSCEPTILRGKEANTAKQARTALGRTAHWSAQAELVADKAALDDAKAEALKKTTKTTGKKMPKRKTRGRAS
jgi:hypothetical protein